MTIIGCWMATVLAVVGQQGGPQAVRAAVVDIAAASERYQKTGDLENRFEQQRLKLNERRDALRQKIERTRRSLQEELKPGTQVYEDRARQLAMEEAELQWFIEVEGRKVEQGLAASLRTIYDDIQRVVYEVAQERNIDLVLSADRLPDEPPANPTQARQQIVLQKVLYWHPRIDLTDTVIARLNAKYQKEKSAAPSGVAPPPLSEKP